MEGSPEHSLISRRNKYTLKQMFLYPIHTEAAKDKMVKVLYGVTRIYRTKNKYSKEATHVKLFCRKKREVKMRWFHKNRERIVNVSVRG